MSRIWSVRIGSALCAAAICLTSPAWAEPSADDIAEARTRYKKGLDLYQEGAFDAALIELQKAYDKAPTYKILYNIALVNNQLNDYAGALRNFRRYLEEGGKKLDAKRRAEVEREIKKLEGRVATIALEVTPDGADVLVDDLVIGQAPLSDPLVVNAGKRKIGAAKPGYFPMARVVVVGGGDEKQLTLNLRDTSSGPPPSSPSTPATGGGETPKSPPPAAADSPSDVPWALWGITAGLGVATGVAGFLTLGAEKDLDDKRAAPATKDDLDSAASKTRTLAIVTDVLLVGTVAVGGYALYVTVAGGSDDAPSKDAALRLQVGPGSVGLTGAF